MRLLRFRCTDCDLQMVLEERPDRCPSCGSGNLVREGWKLRARAERIDRKECGLE